MDGFQNGEEGVIQILGNNAQAGGIPAWANGAFSVAISVDGGTEGTDWEMRSLPEDAAGDAQGVVIDDCDTNCGIVWTDTTNGANAYLRILRRIGADLSVYLVNEPRAATTPGAISVIVFAVASPIVASFDDNSDAEITEGGGALSRSIQLLGGSRTAFTLSVSIFSPPDSTPAKYNGIDNLASASPGDDDFSVSALDLQDADQCRSAIIIGTNRGTICTLAVAALDPLPAIPFNFTASADAIVEETESFLAVILSSNAYNVADNAINGRIANAAFPLNFADTAPSVQEGQQVVIGLEGLGGLALGGGISIDFQIDESAAVSDFATYGTGEDYVFVSDTDIVECDDSPSGGMRNCNVVFPADATDYALTVAADADGAVEGQENFVLRLIANPGVYTPGNTFQVNGRITETPEIGFTTGEINVPWGDVASAPQGNLTVTLRFSPPLDSAVNYGGNGLRFNRGGSAFSADDIPAAGDSAGDSDGLVCGVGGNRACRFDDRNVIPAGTEEFVGRLRIVQSAANVVGPLTITLFDEVRTIANGQTGDGITPSDDDYVWVNQNLIVNIINPIITRTTPSPINVGEGQSANVIFRRNPAIGDGDNFVVGVGFPLVNGAEAADIATITVNGTPCDLAASPITCTGDFGSGVDALTVAISITVDFELNESQELIVLSLQEQNAHDVNPSTGLLATVIIGNVDPLVGFSAVLPTTPIFWGQPIPLSVTVSQPSPSALSVSVRVTGPGGASSLLPPANPDNNDPQCVQAASGYFCRIGGLALGDDSPSAENPLQANPVGGYVLSLTLNQNSIPGNNYAADANADAVTISISRYAVTLSVANTAVDGFQNGEEGVIQILGNNAQAGGIPAWANGAFSVAISVDGGTEGTDWEMRSLPEDAAGDAQGVVIDDCDTNCGIVWTDTTNGANAYLRILRRIGADLSVYLVNEPRAATTPGAISVIVFAVASPIVASFADNSDAEITEGGGALSRNIELSGGSRTAFTLSVSIFSSPDSTPAKYNGIDNLGSASPGDDDFSVSALDLQDADQCRSAIIIGTNRGTICTLAVAALDPLAAIPFNFTASADAIVEGTESFRAVILSSNAYNVADNAINGRIVNAAFQLNFADTNPSVQEGQQVTISLAGPPGLALRGGISIDFRIDERTAVSDYGTDEDYVFVSDTDIVECGDSPSGGMRNCNVVFPADATDYALTVAADADGDDEGEEDFVLRLVTNAANAYTVGDDVVAVVNGRITETPEVAFDIAARTTPERESVYRRVLESGG